MCRREPTSWPGVAREEGDMDSGPVGRRATEPDHRMAKTSRCQEIEDCEGSASLHSKQPERLLLCHRWRGERSCRENECADRLAAQPETRRTGKGAVFFASGTWNAHEVKGSAPGRNSLFGSLRDGSQALEARSANARGRRKGKREVMTYPFSVMSPSWRWANAG